MHDLKNHQKTTKNHQKTKTTPPWQAKKASDAVKRPLCPPKTIHTTSLFRKYTPFQIALGQNHFSSVSLGWPCRSQPIYSDHFDVEKTTGTGPLVARHDRNLPVFTISKNGINAEMGRPLPRQLLCVGLLRVVCVIFCRDFGCWKKKKTTQITVSRTRHSCQHNSTYIRYYASFSWSSQRFFWIFFDRYAARDAALLEWVMWSAFYGWDAKSAFVCLVWQIDNMLYTCPEFASTASSSRLFRIVSQGIEHMQHKSKRQESLVRQINQMDWGFDTFSLTSFQKVFPVSSRNRGSRIHRHVVKLLHWMQCPYPQ